MAEGTGVHFVFEGREFADTAAGLEKWLQSFNSSIDDQVKTVSGALRDWLNLVARSITSKHGVPYPGGTTDKSLSLRSGKGMASIMRSVSVSGGDWASLTGMIGGAQTLAIHEFGGTITAKSGRMLTIPLPAALDQRGVPLKKSAREWQNTYVATTKAGNTLIFQRRGGQVVPLYILKPSVTIRPRLGMRNELNAKVPYFVDRAVDIMAQKIMSAMAR